MLIKNMMIKNEILKIDFDKNNINILKVAALKIDIFHIFDMLIIKK